MLVAIVHWLAPSPVGITVPPLPGYRILLVAGLLVVVAAGANALAGWIGRAVPGTPQKSWTDSPTATRL